MSKEVLDKEKRIKQLVGLRDDLEIQISKLKPRNRNKIILPNGRHQYISFEKARLLKTLSLEEQQRHIQQLFEAQERKRKEKKELKWELLERHTQEQQLLKGITQDQISQNNVDPAQGINKKTNEDDSSLNNSEQYQPFKLTEAEKYLLEEGAKNPALWAAALMPHHASEPFAPFHLELFSLLYSLTTGKEIEVRNSKEITEEGEGGGMALHGSKNKELALKNFSIPPNLVDNRKSQLLRSGYRVRKLAIAAPRGHAKTTVMMLFMLWCVCYQMRRFIVLISDTEDQAKLQLDAMKAELEGNELLRRLYGDLVGDLWGAESIQTSTGIRIQIRGAGQRIRGLKFREQRPDLIVCDDILNDEWVINSEQRSKLKRWFFGAVMPALAKGGGIVVVGTILHESDLLSELLESGAGWEKRKYSAQEEGVLLWPDYYSEEDLEEIRKEYEEKGELPIYFREYHNRIVSHEASPFQREHFQLISKEEFTDKFYEVMSPKKDDVMGEKEAKEILVQSSQNPLRTFLTVDPAYTQQAKSDYSAFVVVSIDSKQRWYVREAKKERVSQDLLLNKVFDYYTRYRCIRMGMQKQDWTRFYKTIMQDEMRKRNIFLNVQELQTYSPIAKGLANKNSRIARLTKYYVSKSIYHLPGLKDLEAELLAFPNSRYDDLSDALSMQIDLVFHPSAPVKEKSYYEEESFTDPISGY